MSSDIIITDAFTNDQVFTRDKETWLRDTTKLLRRFAKELKGRDVNFMLICGKCQQPIKLEEGANGPEANCNCKQRELR